MQAAMDLVHLNPLVKKAVTLVTGVIIRVTEADIELAVTCKVPWFKVGHPCSKACLTLRPMHPGYERHAAQPLLPKLPWACQKENHKAVW